MPSSDYFGAAGYHAHLKSKSIDASIYAAIHIMLLIENLILRGYLEAKR